MNVLEIQHVSVSYRTHRVTSLKEYAIRLARRTLHATWFHALDDIDITIRRGESVGVIGRNGAGKSTLLRVAAGIITPTRGVTLTRGTVAPIIELGTGFEAELTGRENIFFNGALLGRTRAEMRANEVGIIDFAGLNEFIDEPLRTYSTGMVARLAFAVATAVDADTVLLDEILSVGDAAFKARCAERIGKFIRSGSTIVLVSHELPVIEELCSRVLWLDGGRVVADGPASQVVAKYTAAQEKIVGAGGAAKPSSDSVESPATSG